MMDMKEKIAAACGKRKAQTVFKNGTVINVFSGELLRADVAVCGGTIVGVGDYEGETEYDVSGKYIAPGFIDSHLHIESSMTTPANFVSRVLAQGTTTLVADPHELANVSGTDGLEFMLSEAERLPCNLFVMLPSCVPATPFEDSGAVLSAKELSACKNRKNVAGLGEMMNFVGVTGGDGEVLDKLAAFENSNIDGHAPGLCGKPLCAYRLAGITTDHECTTKDEVADRIRAGMFVLAREGSAAKNLEDIVRAIQELGFGYSRVAFCTDDKHIEDIRSQGHISSNIRKAIALGVPLADAYRMATINAAEHYGFRGIGAVAPGYQADLVILDDAKRVVIDSVWYKGVKMSERCEPAKIAEAEIPEALLGTVRLAPLGEDSFRLKVTREKSPVIEVIPGQIVTGRADSELPTQDGYFVPGRKYQKIAVIERHHATGRIGLGVVTGLNIDGALASTVGHDSHNLLVIGSSDRDMLAAVKELERTGGGFALAQNGRIVDSLALPVCGLISDAPPEQTVQKLREMTATARGMGVPEDIEPFVTSSFLALPVIPRLRITNRGVFDLSEQSFLSI